MLKHLFFVKMKKASIRKKQSLFIYIHVTDFKKIISDVLEGFFMDNDRERRCMYKSCWHFNHTFINWNSQTIVFKGLKIVWIAV